MPRRTAENQFSVVLQKFVAERQECLAVAAMAQARVEEIDALFAKHGVVLRDTAGTPRRGPGRRKARASGGRKRGSFAQTGEEAVLAFVKQEGRPSTADVNAFWQSQGRKGKANNTLTKLFQEGKLKRLKDDEGRGSRYSLA